jgi:hypothetical protein
LPEQLDAVFSNAELIPNAAGGFDRPPMLRADAQALYFCHHAVGALPPAVDKIFRAERGGSRSVSSPR